MNPLDYLSEDQRDQLYNWLLDMPTQQVVEKLALPAPDGFGIKTHVTTLRRFKDRRWAELAADHIQAATQPTGTTAEQHDKLDTGILTAIKHHMFQRASAHDINDDQLALVSRWAHRQEKLKLEIQRVQIARERCAQNDRRLQLLARSKNLSFSGGTRPQSPTSTPGNFVNPNAQPSANPNNPDHPVNPVETPNLNSQLDDRPRDHLGPLARNWEDVRERARKAFGITPEESARRAELRRRLCPHLYNNGGTRPESPTSTSRDAITSDNAAPAGQENQDSRTNPANPDHPVNPVEIPNSNSQLTTRGGTSSMSPTSIPGNFATPPAPPSANANNAAPCSES